ncbi:TPA: hypothetical protein ACQVKY_001099 [Serratia marcescens]|uniref:Uncharacterized protein n=1 Tax=Serratia nevei TaxID=2703794 RepID=A0ABT7G5P8_9GAMM|nr:hypothetical protein [Serratia nevei]HAU4290911.1 hypothetical protein [Serratia marcescens]MDK5169079.1 hypothetical protein [Serratia nevei]MDK5298573.1 hypothetical protein [Serratia nevei]MEC5887175.1 hypothetical protein [Serratia nevei]HAU4299277.1 hypothetical protein [Serratia marcescens]
MNENSVNRGVAGSVLVGGLAAGAVMANVSSLPQASRIKFVKFVVFLMAAFVAAVLLIPAFGLFGELSQVPAAEKGMAAGVAVLFALPAAGVVFYGLKKLVGLIRK